MNEIEKENARLSRAGKVINPSRKRIAVDHVVEHLGASERRACRVIGQHRSTKRKPRKPRGDEATLTDAIIKLASRCDRYGYRRTNIDREPPQPGRLHNPS